MNFVHRRLCRSARWRSVLEQFVVPSALADGHLGEEVLELGPGDGLTTELLRPHISRITALEIHPPTAKKLAARFRGTNVTALQGDASAMQFPDGQFSGVVSLHVLHHIPSVELQDKVFREVRRVLRPGGVFVCIDSVNFRTLPMRLIHIGDKIVPVDPAALEPRLGSAGFCDISIDTNPYSFKFRARRPLQP
ncbi:MAG: class I SAM-dependent methyltransferase [Candidatus Acidiferrales bacterium]